MMNLQNFTGLPEQSGRDDLEIQTFEIYRNGKGKTK